MTTLATDTAAALLQAQGGSTNAIGESAKRLDSASKNRDLAAINAAAEDFEAVFIAEMMKPMFDGIKTDGPFGGGKGEEIFRGMMLQEYGKMMAQTGDIGLSDTVRAHMIAMQEEADTADNAGLETGLNTALSPTTDGIKD